MQTLAQSLDVWLGGARSRVEGIDGTSRQESIGRLQRIGDGVAFVSGLADVQVGGLLALPGDLAAMAFDLTPDTVGCLLLGSEDGLQAGSLVRVAGDVVRVPVGAGLLGRAVDPLGRPLDGAGPVAADGFEPVERPAPAIVDRAPVTEPLFTGTTLVDALFPVGRGQRELIIGDRVTGKTTLAVDAILRQRTTDVVSIYCAIGQRMSAVREVMETVRRHGAPDRTLFVVAPPDSAPGLQWLAPYAAMTMAEWFRDRGQHALVVLDDLSHHAAVHRQVSLLLHRPAGREAFPGDVFYLHARLLERSAKLAPAQGGGSLTCLPIVETQAGNLAAYIPTNLISITDGQIYLDARLFQAGQRPAVDIGRSVSRVGGRTQPKALRSLAEPLRLDYAQFLELESFTRFGGMSDDRTRSRIERGRRLRALLAQPRHVPALLAEEVTLLSAFAAGQLDPVPVEAVAALRAELPDALRSMAAEVSRRLEETGRADAGDLATLDAVAARIISGLSSRGSP